MKKKYLVWILAAVLGLNLNAQQSVFILYDISGNVKSDPYKITKSMRTEARSLAKEVITGKMKSKYSNWEYLPGNNSVVINDIFSGKSSSPLLKKNGYFMIMPFGEHETYKKMKIEEINNYPSDFYDLYEFPFKHNELSTYGNIASAQASMKAMELNINSYTQITIIGKGEDTQSGSYTSEETAALDFYKTKAIITPLGLFRNILKGIDYTIQFSNIKIVDQPPQPPPKHKHKIRLIEPKNSKKSEPLEFDSGQDVFVKWSCIQINPPCPESTKWSLIVSQLDGDYRKTFQSGKLKHKKLKLDDGKYQITLTANNRKLQDIYVKIGGSCFLCILIPMIIIGLIAFYLPKYLKRKKPPIITTGGPEVSVVEEENSGEGMI
jgi:hypothetical protein